MTATATATTTTMRLISVEQEAALRARLQMMKNDEIRGYAVAQYGIKLPGKAHTNKPDLIARTVAAAGGTPYQRKTVDVATLGDAPALPFPLLGWTISYRLHGVETTHAALCALLTAEGLTAYAPPEITPREALRRAVEKWVRNRRGGALFGNNGELKDDGNGTAHRAILRAANNSAKEIMRFALVTEEVDMQSLGLAYTGKTYFVLNKKTGEFMAVVIDAANLNDRARDDQERAIYREVAPLFARYRELQEGEDISKAIRRNIIDGTNAVALRQGGGFYFVPQHDAATITGVRRVFDALATGGGDAFLLTIPAIDYDGAARSLGQMAHAAFRDDIATLDAEIERLAAKPDGSVKPETIAAKVQEFKALRVKAEAYTQLLTMRDDDVQAMIAALADKARAIVTKGALPGDDDDEPVAVAVGRRGDSENAK